MQKRRRKHLGSHRRSWNHRRSLANGLRASKEKSLDTATGREKDCAADMHIGCQADRGGSQDNRPHCNHDRDGSLSGEFMRLSNENEI